MIKRFIFIILSLVIVFTSFSFLFAQNWQVEVSFFYSAVCPHCAAEKPFLDKIEKKYPEAKINRYLITDPETQEVLINLCQKCNAEQYMGLVPLTFVNEEFFVGFDNEDGVGRKIENAIRDNLGLAPLSGNEDKIIISFFGKEIKIDIKAYSLPLQAVVLGFLDGFNICSLGALILILGLVLSFRSRIKILIFGSIFIFVTAVIYGILIFLWYQLFSLLFSFIKIMQIFVGILGIGGGIFFLKNFFEYRKKGPVCEMGTGQGIASQFSLKFQELLKKPGNTLLLLGSIFLFAAIITIVEFPCSAVIPVFFASALAQSQLSAIQHVIYIIIFVLFYMLDEIIVFLIAFFTMKVWFASKKFIIWLTLIEAIFLFLLGSYYLYPVLFP